MLAQRKYQSSIAFLLLAFITAFLTGCGGGSSTTATTPSISTTTVPDATTGTAYTTSITASGGTAPYTWSLSSGTLPAGLALGSSTTASVAIAGTPTSAQQGAAFTVQVKDSAAKTASKAFTMNVVSTLSVTIDNKLAGIAPAAAAVTFTATVHNDPANQGVTWDLMAGTTPCSPTCGTLTSTSTPAVTVIYTPPATVPASPNNSVTITAKAVADDTKSDSDLLTITNSPLSACTQTGNEAVLNGKYAFLLQGQNTVGTTQMVGSFTADGTGKITAGEVDVNGAAHSNANLDTTATTYSVGADNRGCMTLKTAGSTTVVHFALGSLNANVATKGRLIQFDDAVGTGTRATGLLLKQDNAAIATNLSGNYALNLVGVNNTAGRYTVAGATTVSGTLLIAGEVDVDDAGAASHATGASGLLNATLTANGRGTFTLIPTVTSPTNFVFYIVSSAEVLVASTDPIATAPVASGEMRLQSGTFTDASLSGASVVHMSGFGASARIAALGILTPNGAGNITASVTSQTGTTATAASPVMTTYSVAANGRTTLAASAVRVIYLTGANAGFVAASDASATTGELEAQTGGPFTASNLSGAYFFGTEAVATNAATTTVGVTTADGVGQSTISADMNSATGALHLSIDTNTTGTYMVNPDGTATIAGNTALVVSPSKVLAFDSSAGNANPNVVVLEK